MHNEQNIAEHIYLCKFNFNCLSHSTQYSYNTIKTFELSMSPVGKPSTTALYSKIGYSHS